MPGSGRRLRATWLQSPIALTVSVVGDLARGLETIIGSVDTGRSIAWFPIPLKIIIAHPGGRMWAGTAATMSIVINWKARSRQ